MTRVFSRVTNVSGTIARRCSAIILKRIIEKLNIICGYVGGVFIVISAVIMLYDVVCRYFFNAPSAFAPFIVSFLILGAIFFGAGYSFQSGAQVFIEIFVDKLPPLPRKICHTIGHCMALVFVSVLITQTWKYAVKAFHYNWMTYGNVRIPSGILYGIMVFGSVLLFLAVVLATIKIWTKKDDVTEVYKQ